MQTKKHSHKGKTRPLKLGHVHEEPHSSHKKIVFIFIAVVAVILGAVGWFWNFYQNKALPNVAVGSVVVSGQTPEEIKHAVMSQAPALKVTFDDNGKKTTVAAKDLGITIDADATVQNVLNARRGGDAWQDMQVWQTHAVPLVLVNDPGVLIAYAKAHYPTIFVDAKEPQIVYNDSSKSFEVTPGTPGKGLDIKSFERALPSLALEPQNFTLKLTSAEVAPLLEETKLREVAARANRIAEQKVAFTLEGQEVYHATREDIASWINFTPDATKGTMTLIVDTAKVNQFVGSKVGSAVASPPVDRKVVVDSTTGVQTVIAQGKSGSQIQDIDPLAKEIADSLTAGRSITKGISIASAPFKTVTMSGTGKWIEVDLSTQTLTLWLGDEVVKSVLISSGKAATPTEVGEFAVYSKVPEMTMTGTIAGDYFYVPNIKWVSFFDGGEAFHGTYWHHNFGHPMSHGCINMTEADAKMLYDFAPIGTKVIVHA